MYQADVTPGTQVNSSTLAGVRDESFLMQSASGSIIVFRKEPQRDVGKYNEVTIIRNNSLRRQRWGKKKT